MKSKYAFTLHFFRISSKKEEQAKVWDVLKEYQTFAESYAKYSFYYYLSPNSIPPAIAARLPSEIQSALSDKRLEPHFDAIKMARAKDTFFGISCEITHRIEAKLNIQMFQYALELVNKRDEAKEKLMKRRLESQQRRLSKSGFGSWGRTTLHCCNLLFFLVVVVVLYLVARYYFGKKWEEFN